MTDNDNNTGPDVKYTSNGDGRWWKTVWQKQCPEKVFLSGQCQGVVGHKAAHWMYKPCGSYAWDRNEADPDSWIPRAAAGYTPPDCKEYIEPKTKHMEFWLHFSETTEVTDPLKITALDNGELEEGESAIIDEPLTEEELKWCREHGRLDGLIDEVIKEPEPEG